MGRADRRRAGQGQRGARRVRLAGGIGVARRIGERDPLSRAPRGRLGAALVAAALAGAAIAGYLSLVRTLGEPAVCGPSHGCETVAASPYSVVLGVPVAYLGLGLSIVVAALAVRWWRRRDRWALAAAYGLLVLATLYVGYLTYLELFVIDAICPWCVAYAVATVAALAAAGAALLATAVPGRTP